MSSGQVADPVEAVAVEAAPEARLTAVERFVDRLNPILVRELQQSLNGRAFFATLGLALLAIVLAALSSSGGYLTGDAGFTMFVLAVRLLMPVVVVAIPQLMFMSMRQEVTAGTVEHLLLSRLTPGAIVRGKLYAAMVQLVLFMSVFAPLIGMTYLLRGVDAPTLIETLAIAALTGLVASSFAIMMGAFSRYQALRALPFLMTVVGLALLCVMIEGGAEFFIYGISSALSESVAGSRTPTVLGAMFAPALVAIGLFVTSAAAALAHPNENRSSLFRIQAVLLLLGTFGWLAWLQHRTSAMGGADLEEVAPMLAGGAALALFPWVHFAVTESPSLSVRVRTRVARNPGLAAFSAPWLPGAGRGFLFTLVLAVIALAGAIWVPSIFAGEEAKDEWLRFAFAAWSYLLVYAGIVAFLRSRLPPTSRATIALRVFGILGVALVPLVPRLLDVISDVRIRSWELQDLLNPFVTVRAIRRAFDVRPLPIILTAAAVVVLLNLPSMIRGVREVMVASRDRKARAG